MNRIAWAAMVVALACCLDSPARGDTDTGEAKSPKVLVVSPFRVYLLGKPEPKQWQRIDDTQQDEDVAALKTWSEKAIGRGTHRLLLTESPHFLLYSDLPADDVKEDLLGLENAYTQFSKFLGVLPAKKPKDSLDKSQGPDVWRGKLVLFIFDGHEFQDARQFVRTVHPGEADLIPTLTLNGNGSADLVSIQYTGDVFMQRDQAKAMALAFLYRLHKPVMLEPWLAGGLAQSFGNSLLYPPVALPNRPRPAPEVTSSARILRDHLKTVPDLVDAIEHPDLHTDTRVYSDLVSFMIARNSRRFVDFVQNVKDGQPWQKSLEKKYGLTVEDLASSYEQWVAHLRG